jgi:TatD family-associated radical SAM protein
MKEKGMEIVYRVHNGLYVNLTNRCSSSCTFCLRQSLDRVGQSDPLWLEREPELDEVKAAFARYDLASYDEIVFCGFGEPTCRLTLLLATAAWLRTVCDLPLRLNTNGQGSLINGRDITGELAEVLDAVSVSLNHPDPERYRAIVRSRFGEEAYPAMLKFAADCAAKGLDVTMTTVETTISREEEQRCREICADLGVKYRIRAWAGDTQSGAKG